LFLKCKIATKVIGSPFGLPYFLGSDVLACASLWRRKTFVALSRRKSFCHLALVLS